MSFLFLLLALQQTPAPVTPQAPATKPAPAPRRAPVAATVLEIKVTDRSGRPIANAAVSAEGPASQSGQTDAHGIVTLAGLTAGSYLIRAEADQFVPLEREVTIRGKVDPIQFGLARAFKPIAAPEPPPPPPPPPPAPIVEAGVPGEPRVASIPDLAEKSLKGKDAVTIVPIACSGTSNVRLILLRDEIPAGSHRDESQTLYMVSGQATLMIRDQAQTLEPGWVGVVPRTIPYSLVRKGKNPAVLLSVTGGQPCVASPAQP